MKEVKINMGCGKRNFGKSWIHIDGGDFPHLHSHNIKKLPFKKNSVDLIYSSHVLEYFDRIEVLNVLKEWGRVLKPGGILRVAVPDFQVMTSLYGRGLMRSSRASMYRLRYFLGPLYGKMSMGKKTIYHKTVYDFDDLRDVLSECGFENIHRYSMRDTHPHNLPECNDHSWAHIPRKSFVATKEKPFDHDGGFLISLNVECTKAKDI